MYICTYYLSTPYAQLYHFDSGNFETMEVWKFSRKEKRNDESGSAYGVYTPLIIYLGS